MTLDKAAAKKPLPYKFPLVKQKTKELGLENKPGENIALSNALYLEGTVDLFDKPRYLQLSVIKQRTVEWKSPSSC